MAHIIEKITLFAFLSISTVATQSAALYLDDYDQMEFNMSFSAPTLIKDTAWAMYDFGMNIHRRVTNRLYPFPMLTKALLTKDSPYLMMAIAIMMAGHDMTHPGQLRNAKMFMASLDEQRSMENEDFLIAVQQIEDMKRSPLFMDYYAAAKRIDQWQTNVLFKSLIGELLVKDGNHVTYLSSMLLIAMIDEVSSFEQN